MIKKAVEYTLKAEKKELEQVKIVTSEDAASYARNFYHDDIFIYESSFIILLNSANKAIGYAKISQGGICQTVVDKKIIAKYAIDSLASGVIFIHNHPSGNVKPSMEDKKMTDGLKKMMDILNVNLVDSIILSSEDHFSMTDEGLI